MAISEIRYAEVTSADLTVERLPDGSTAVLDQRSKDVHSLNPSATIVWEACSPGATLAEVRKALEAKVGTPVDEAVALNALSQLQNVNLIQTDAPVPESMASDARRKMLLRLGAIAAPLVLTLAFSQQKASAVVCGSGSNCGA